MNNPFLSIVVANYNYGRFLPEAIESVISQCEAPKTINGRNILPVKGCDGYGVELIICDAASTDNSVDVIRHYDRYLSWWCSESDDGQSAAFNKGFRQSRGDWLTWLNADELYANGMLLALFRLIKRKKTARWITGNYVNFNDADKIITHVTWGPHISPSFLSNKHYPYAVFGSTSFWRKDVYDSIGPIDEKLHYAMDTDYWIRLVMGGVRQTRLNHYCWLFRDHEASKTVGNKTLTIELKQKKEQQYIIRKNKYEYKYLLSNPWYLFWLIMRVVDGSVFVRSLRRLILIGKSISSLTTIYKD